MSEKHQYHQFSFCSTRELTLDEMIYLQTDFDDWVRGQMIDYGKLCVSENIITSSHESYPGHEAER